MQQNDSEELVINPGRIVVLVIYNYYAMDHTVAQHHNVIPKQVLAAAE